jgi:hypothetical protein
MRVGGMRFAQWGILCGAASGVAGVAAADPVPSKAMCDPETRVDRVDWICVGREDGERNVDSSVRRDDGWHSDPARWDFTAEETARFDGWLAEGIRRMCAKDDLRDLAWSSIHQPKWGWPLDGRTCRYGAWSLVLHKGAATLTIDRPHVEEMELAQWLVHLHAYAINITWKTKPATPPWHGLQP